MAPSFYYCLGFPEVPSPGRHPTIGNRDCAILVPGPLSRGYSVKVVGNDIVSLAIDIDPCAFLGHKDPR